MNYLLTGVTLKRAEGGGITRQTPSLTRRQVSRMNRGYPGSAPADKTGAIYPETSLADRVT